MEKEEKEIENYSHIYSRRIDIERAKENFQRFPRAREGKDC